MHFWTEDPILFVQESGMRNIDPQNPENLFGMWSVFSKASGILENGRRLENLSWRLWQQQSLCARLKQKARSTSSTAPPDSHISASAPQQSRLPELSSSVDSAASSTSSRTRKDSSSSSSTSASSNSSTQQGQSRSSKIHQNMFCVSHDDMTTLDLQNLVMSIKVKQDLTGPLSPLPTVLPQRTQRTQRPQRPERPERPERFERIPNTSHPVQESTPTPRTSSARPLNVESSASTILSSSTNDSTYLSPTNASETSVDSDSSHHSVVRGFEPGTTGISTYKSQSQLAPSPTPILKPSTSSVSRSIRPKRSKGGVFQVGGSSGEDESSLRDHMSPHPRSTSLSTVAEKSSSFSSKKQISFVEHDEEEEEEQEGVAARFPKKKFMFADDDDGAAIESESEDDSQDDEEVSESAIDDDDAWEDEGESEERPKQLVFHRVESKADLVSRRSLITDNLHESNRAAALQHAAALSTPLMRRSRTSTPNGPSMPASPTHESPVKLPGEADSSTSKLGGETSTTSSKSRPTIAPTTKVHPPCPPMSPRATRRNMVSQELGVSLRKHMLNERHFKNLYAQTSSPLRRTQMSADVKPLEQPQEPGSVYPMASDGGNIASSNDAFDHDMSDYHRKGW